MYNVSKCGSENDIFELVKNIQLLEGYDVIVQAKIIFT